MKKGMGKRLIALLLAAMLTVMTGCAGQNATSTSTAASTAESVAEAASTAEVADAAATEEAPEETAEETEEPAEETPAEEAPAEVEKNGEIYILFTSDMHCGVDQGFGLAGVAQVRAYLESQGYETILVDDGDAIQGEPLGTISKGSSIISLMNAMKYDVAIPGNHEFDYGMENFLKLTEEADFPYISCNFNKEGELIFAPYIVKELAGIRIGFVGVTTPQTLTSSTPRYFQNEAGEYIYGFLQDDSGESVYAAVQDAVDAARADGADLVYVMAHCGNEEAARPWTYADIIGNTNGIDVLFDGHSHDTDQVVMKNKDGEDVTRSACGTKLSCIGYSRITAEGEVAETGVWTWNNKIPATDMFGISNEISEDLRLVQADLEESLTEVIATSAFELTISDPVETDSSGKPIRMVRRAETNLGDLCADAYRDQGQADIALVNGGGIRVSVDAGDITYGNILSVNPFGNELCVLEVTGQQVLDALEWGCRSVPEENGGFPQVSGLSYEIDTTVESTCTQDENGMFTGVKGKRRVQNVLVGDEPIDPKKTYTLAGHNYMLLSNGDGYTAFDGATVLQDSIKLDNQVLMDYISETLGGVISEDYADPYGQGRIVILE
ncbi:MAG: bifunctional metallophosphatase/5'-nucleotidase [Lachnospiraceae bacterium]|nr:bifunctional metallophosphatase/5'-nucleotidase [Lachnospiraceae bacterium]